MTLISNVVLLRWVFPVYLTNDTGREVQERNVVLWLDVGHDVLVEKLENEGDAVGEHEVLGHELKLHNHHIHTVASVFASITFFYMPALLLNLTKWEIEEICISHKKFFFNMYYVTHSWELFRMYKKTHYFKN